MELIAKGIGRLKSYISPALHEKPPDLLREHVPLQAWAIRVVIHMLHNHSLATINLDIRWRGTVRWIIGIRATDISHLQHHVRRAVFFPKRDADVLHAVSAEIGIFEKVRVDRNLGVEEGVIRNAAGTLLGIVVFAAKDVGILVGGVKLAGGEEHHVAMIHTIKGEIDVARSVDVWDGVVGVVGFSNERWAPIGEGAWGFGCCRNFLEARVLS